MSNEAKKLECYVAPRAGAWIETSQRVLGLPHLFASLPARERGLKHVKAMEELKQMLSLPARERGLKRI